MDCHTFGGKEAEKTESENLVCYQVGQICYDLLVQSSRFDEFVGNREICNLSIESGPVLKKMKGIS